MNNILPLIMLMSGFNNNRCDCEPGNDNCTTGNGFGNLLPLLFLTGGLGGGCGNSCTSNS